MEKYTMQDFVEKKIAVHVGVEHFTDFMKLCDLANLCWVCFDKASNWKPEIMREDLCIAYNNGILLGGLTYGGRGRFLKAGYKVVKISAFKEASMLPDPLPPFRKGHYKIVIESDGDLTTASMIVGGKEVKTASARRNPGDKPHWVVGAKLAFHRLFEKKG